MFAYENGKEYAVITTKNGEIVLELYRDVAPLHVANFEKLIKQGFYDGLSFHRVIDNFVAQGGCPQGTGTGGPGWNVKAEFSAKPHLQGTLAMARAQDPNSAGSQFYICLERLPHLDRNYTVFGQTVSGFEHVKAIRQGDKMLSVSYVDKREA